MTVDQSLAIDRALAGLLPTVWDAFFARFGRLTEVQRRTIEPVLEGHDVLVCAPTASGKTEAVCAPLVERLLSHGARGSVLYVCPTRALVNDLFERLTPPLGLLGLRLVRRTGDHKDRIRGTPHVIVTTPESFDSLLCRGRREGGGHTLATVSAVVLDEIHLVHNNPRGEQLRWLLERLRRLKAFGATKGWCTGPAFQRVALSATVASPPRVVARFMPGGNAISVDGGRDIETVSTEAPSPSVEDVLPRYLTALPASEKVLVFCNARKRVDSLTLSLRPQLEALGYVVRAHHGSLSREEREQTEHDIKNGTRVVVFATSTLEIGVDIGDIDLIVLDGPAPDVASLLQRVGRGNRRTEKTRLMQCAGSAAEVLVQAAMLSAARDGQLDEQESGPQYAVVRQQIASYILQGPSRARSRHIVGDLVSTCEPAVDVGRLIDHLVQHEDFEESGDGIRLGSDWREAASKGAIHSNIESTPGEKVVEQRTARTLAHHVRFLGGKGLGVAGNLLRVRERDDWHLFVERVNDPRLAAGAWAYVTSAWVEGAGQPQAVRRYLGFDPDEWPVFADGDKTWVFHFGGVRSRATISMVIDTGAGPHSGITVDGWTVCFPYPATDAPTWFGSTSAAVLSTGVAGRLTMLERLLARPRANRKLPHELRLAEVERWLAIPQELERIQRARWVTPANANQREALALLVAGVQPE